MMETILRDRTRKRDSFIFSADRFSRLLIEEALNFVPFSPQSAITPTGSEYKGTRINEKVCSISIMRSGDAMTKAVVSVLQNVKLGSVLI